MASMTHLIHVAHKLEDMEADVMANIVTQMMVRMTAYMMVEMKM
jgi:hypothetical protein